MMDRTPVTVAEMVNGDLIAHSNWEDDGDDKVATFIGRIPLSPCRFVTLLRNGNPAISHYCGGWFRLTNPATLCKHCGKPIHRQDLDEFVTQWVHANGRLACYVTLATPAEVQS